MAILEISVTNQCLGRCLYCPFNASDTIDESLPVELLVSSLQTIDPVVVDHVIFSGGDALEWSWLEEIVRVVTEKGISFDIYSPCLNSNSLSKLFRILGEKGSLLIPYWSANSRESDFLSGWDWINSLDVFDDLCIGNIKFKAIVYLTTFNSVGINDTITYLLNRGAVNVTLKRSLPGLGSRGHWSLLVPAAPQVLSSEQVFVHMNAWGNVCNIAPKGVYVGHDGVVYPCLHMRNLVLGNINQTALGTIINSIKDWKLPDNIMSDCQTCEAFGHECSGGCVAASSVFSSEVEKRKPDPLCPRYYQSSVSMVAESLFWDEEDKEHG